MDFMETTIDIMYRLARKHSPRGVVDKYWKRILPEALDIAANEIFLALHRVYINESIKQSAFSLAQTAPPRDISKLDDGTLALHSITRQVWLGISETSDFQSLVDKNHGVIYNTADPVRWVKPARIWLPHFSGIITKIYRSLVERYKHYFFAERCYAELVRRGRQNPYMKHTFIQLTDDPDLYQERNEGSACFREASRRIATSVGAQPELGEDAGQDWLAELSGRPLHQQIQMIGATRIAIERDIIDMQRKGGRYEHTHFDDELTESVPDESAKDPNEGILTDEYYQRLLECRPQIEAILSQRSPEVGQRRFQVLMLMLTQTRQNKIAEQLNTDAPIITKDKQVIRQSWKQIQEVLYGRRPD